MPIRPENRDRYPQSWKQIRAQILERAGHACECCKAINHEVIVRGSDGTYMRPHGEVHDASTGEFLGFARGSEYPGLRLVKIALTIAHLDHTPENCDPGNLKAMCQRCHLAYDSEHHAQTARRTRREGRAVGDLFQWHVESR